MALGVIPQRTHEIPRRARILRLEQPAGNRARPQGAGFALAARGHRPNRLEIPLHFLPRAVLVGEALRLLWIGGRRTLLPRFAAVRRLVELRSEVAVAERDEEIAVPWIAIDES